MIESFLEFLHSLTDPHQLVQLLTTVLTGWIGYLTLFAIVFAETGLLVGFFLPGDSLMFTVGVVAGLGGVNLFYVNIVLILAAIIGDSTGYLLGRQTGRAIFHRPDSRLFKREHLIRTQEFYERHGGKTIIYARFIPIIRTFAPFVAGVGEMSYGRFLMFNVVGGIVWVVGITLLGYTLGSIPIIQRNFEKAILLIIFLSITPVLFELYKARRPRTGTAPR